MTTKRIKRIGILSAGYTGLVFSLAFLLDSIIVTFLISTIFSNIFSYGGGLSTLLQLGGYMFVALIIYPIMGFIFGITFAVIYNSLSKFHKGIKIEIN